MAPVLTAHEYPLRRVFSSDYRFRIPDYQRPYRWGAEQALQLLDDLEETLDHGDDDPYFLGSLVLVDAGDHHDVIDGQQRLTTLTILFAVLRDLSEGEEFARNLRDRVMDPGNELDGIAARPRLTLRSQDATFFRTHVQQPGKIEELVALTDASAGSGPQRAIRDNARVLRDRLAHWDDEKRRRLGTLASTRTYLVIVSTPSIESAYRIFSVMNARGLDLTPADIFKSQIIGNLSEEPEYAKQWEDAEQALGSDDFTDLFRDIRTVRSGERPRRELLVEFPEQVLRHYTSTGQEAAFLTDLLLPYASAYERTIAHDLGPGAEWEPVNRRLRHLAMIDNKDWRPAALWALTTRRDDPVALDAFLVRLERLAASLLLRGVYATPRVGRYLELVNELKKGAFLDAPSFDLTEEERSQTRRALDGEIYRMQARRARFVLLRLDEILANDPGATYSQAIISIEHVLPQNPRPASDWTTAFSEDERRYWIHRLGNLVLLNRRKNAQASNYDFAAKKDRYFGASGYAMFALTAQVLQRERWTPTVVEARQRALVGRLVSEWDLG